MMFGAETEKTMNLDRFFPYTLAVIAEAFSRQLTAVYGAEFGLSREEWRLLYLLDGAEKIDSLELSRKTTLDKVQVTRASQRLEQKGLITRKTSEADRRLRVFEMTNEGAALFAQVSPKVQTRAAAILGILSATEREALETGLTALGRAVDQFCEEQET